MKSTQRHPRLSTDTMVQWTLRMLGPCNSDAVEAFLWNWGQVHDSTVRGALIRLRRRGVVDDGGRDRKGCKMWKLAEQRKDRE